VNEERKAANFAEFEELGEADVRLRLKMNHWLRGSPKTALAEEWVRAKDDARIDASNAEHLRIARSEKNAAWIAAISAMIAIIISVIALYLSWLGLDASQQAALFQ
jgi:hypothetical protein